METSNYGPMGHQYQPGYPMNPAVGNLAMAPVANYPPAINPGMVPAYYPTVNTNSHDPQTAPYPPFTGIPGYEGMAGGDSNGKFLPPPPIIGPGPGAVPPPASNDWTIPTISKDTAKQALLEYANGKCCYGTSPVQEMEITQLSPFSTYRYRLETFTESRACEGVTKPLNDQAIDSAANGPAPQPWEIPAQPPTLFNDEIRKMPVPHTSSKKSCQECNGKGKIICQACNGNSQVKCSNCDGSGTRSGEECSNCSGSGTKGCNACNQTNVQTCPACSGKGQVITYIELTITWKNNLFEFIPDHHSDFPTDLFKKVSGEKLFMDEQLLVPPLMNFPEQSINQASQNAVQQHYSQYISSCRILKQRQSIEWLPLNKVEYTWKGKNCSYYVYGKENKVETKNYPDTCCCVIL
ncbi:protein SSUH2 homolog [Pseudophryne corroboree]|uniref:protein SSUH2 homolog n=1 Tax=Pseudophryne corroboree TaxID=495146 RepID=UPI0030814BA2